MTDELTNTIYYGIDPGANGAFIAIRLISSGGQENTVLRICKDNGYWEFKIEILYIEKFRPAKKKYFGTKLDSNILDVLLINSVISNLLQHIPLEKGRFYNDTKYLATCEVPFAPPRSGTNVAMKMGINFGILLNALVQYMDNCKWIRPSDWTKFYKENIPYGQLSILSKIKEDKKLLSEEMFYILTDPDDVNEQIEIIGKEWSRTYANGIYDAFCIALYGALLPYMNEKFKINLIFNNNFVKKWSKND